jgi:hypothetical protein
VFPRQLAAFGNFAACRSLRSARLCRPVADPLRFTSAASPCPRSPLSVALRFAPLRRLRQFRRLPLAPARAFVSAFGRHTPFPERSESPFPSLFPIPSPSPLPSPFPRPRSPVPVPVSPLNLGDEIDGCVDHEFEETNGFEEALG